jgi:hypothetical protein
MINPNDFNDNIKQFLGYNFKQFLDNSYNFLRSMMVHNRIVGK